MSNSKNILYLLSLILLMLTGCEAETLTVPLPNQGEEPVEVRFHAINVGADVMVSRANYSSTSLLEDKIGICNEFFNNISLTYKNNETPNLSTTYKEKIYYPYNTKELPVYAYAPYSETEFDAQTGTVNVKSEWIEESAYSNYITDPIWACDTITKEAPTAEFSFKHQISRLKVNWITDSESEENDSMIEDWGNENYIKYTLTLTFDRTQHGQMNIKDGTITPTQNGEYDYIETWSDDTGTSMPAEIDHTILPGSILKKIKIQFTVGSNDLIIEDETDTGIQYIYKNDNLNRKFEVGKYIQMYINLGDLTKDEYKVNP